MEFRRGHRDERRRRALIDDPGGEPGGSAASSRRRRSDSSSSEAAPRYSEAALSPSQPRIVDLIPTRWWTNLVLVLLLLAVGAGLEALYGYVALGYTGLEVSQIPAVDLAVRGSLATWFSSAMLAACAIYGLLIYQVRRHRVDDYRGRYRMWCWVVPVLLLASVDQVAGLQDSARTVLLNVVEIPVYADATLIWIGSLAFIVGVVGLRLTIEMRACLLASLLTLLSLSCLAVVGASRVELLLVDDSILRTMVLAALKLGAHIALLAAVFLYARHVFHDASGRYSATATRKRAKSKKRSEADAASTEQAETKSQTKRGASVRRKADKIIRTDPPHTETPQSDTTGQSGSTGRKQRRAEPQGAEAPRPSRKEKRRVAAEASQTESPARTSICEPDDDQVDQPRKLSKAERKRLRKQRRRQQ